MASRIPSRALIHTEVLGSALTLSKPRRQAMSTYGYAQAKSLVYSKQGAIPDVLSLHTHSISPPHSNLLTLRTLAAPLNPADINLIQGTYAASPNFSTSLGTPNPVAVPGSEACFEVVSAGSGVKTVKRGDWVIPRSTGLGTWRTYLQEDESKVVRVDKEGLKSTQVATVNVNPVTAWRMLKDFVELKPGDWFIQNGANSGVGRAAIQLGRLWGLKSIAVVRARPGEEGAHLKSELEALGATKVVTDEQVAEKGFRDHVKTWTNGDQEKILLALNCVGGDAAMAMAKVLSTGGNLVTYGAMSKSPMRVGASMLIFKDIRFSGFWVSRWADAHLEEKLQTVEEILQLIRLGEFKDVPMEQIPWNWDTKKEVLVEAVQNTLEGYRKGKGMFIFEDT